MISFLLFHIDWLKSLLLLLHWLWYHPMSRSCATMEAHSLHFYRVLTGARVLQQLRPWSWEVWEELAFEMLPELWASMWGGASAPSWRRWLLYTDWRELRRGQFMRPCCQTLMFNCKRFSLRSCVYLLPMPKQPKHRTPLCALCCFNETKSVEKEQG